MKWTLSAALTLSLFASSAVAALGLGDVWEVPSSPRVTFDFDANWKFIRQDVSGGHAVDFDDSTWAVVSTPHT